MPDQMYLVTSHVIVGGAGGRLAGRIHESGSSEPVVGATLVLDIDSSANTAISDEGGRFEIIDVSTGPHVLSVYYDSEAHTFSTIEIRAGERSVIDVGIRVAPPSPGGHRAICEWGEQHYQKGAGPQLAACASELSCCYSCGMAGCDSVCATPTECGQWSKLP